MPNQFDQFDAAPASSTPPSPTASAGNPFDSFDAGIPAVGAPIKFKSQADLAQFRQSFADDPKIAKMSDNEFLDWYGKSRTTPTVAMIDGTDNSPDVQKEVASNYTPSQLMLSKATFGLSDKAQAGVMALADLAGDALHGDFHLSHGQRYNDALARVDAEREAFKSEHPGFDWATLPVNFVGLAGGAPEALASEVGGGALTKAAVTGAGYGALAGAGQARGSYGDEAKTIALSTLGGAVLGPVAQKIIPPGVKLVQGAGSAVKNAIMGAADTAPGAVADRASPQAGNILLKSLADQGMTPRQAGQMLDEAQANGVPLALMDTGDETRGLAASLARKPGVSRTILRDTVIPRQEGQTERVQGAMTRDLGPTANVREQSEALIKGAQAKAGPLYEKAYAQPIPDSEGLQALVGRPSMQSALKRAYSIAKEEGRDPTKVGFNLDAQGNVTIERHNSTQTWDYVKRGLDDVVEAMRDPVTGRLKLDEAGRAINATRATLVKELDRLNPAYAEARKAYAGPAAMASALNKGAKIGAKNAETIMAETRDLTAPELEQYKLGVRSALSNMVEGKTDAADTVKALVGTPAKRKVLAQLFGGERGFDRFLTTLAQEGQAHATFARANLGSPTALNLADDANLSGLTGVAFNAGGRALGGHGFASNAIHTLADLARYGSGEAGERLRAELAAGISETDPAVLSAALRSASRQAAVARVGSRRVAPKIGATAGTLSALAVPRK